MLRGAVVIFTGLMSKFFLGRKLGVPQWTGMILVTIGTACVGASSLVCSGNKADAKDPLLGNILIVLAQIVVAVQMVVEEKLIGGHDIPALKVVGWEGLFGFTILSIVLCIFYHIPRACTVAVRLCASA